MKIYRLEIKSGMPNGAFSVISSHHESSYVKRYEYYKDKAKAEHRKAQVDQAAMTINLVPHLIGTTIDELEVIE